MFEPSLGLGLKVPRGHFFVVLVLEKRSCLHHCAKYSQWYHFM